MAVYFVYRCSYAGPTALHRKRFDDATLLDWFRDRWRPFADYVSASDYLAELLGMKVYSIGDLFFRVTYDEAEPAEQVRPDTVEAVEAAFSRTYQTAFCFEEHCAQVLTDDDERDMAYFFFDDDFVARHPDLTAFLLHEGPLPENAGPGGWRPDDARLAAALPVFEGGPEGRVYYSHQCPHDGCWHEDMGEGDLDLFAGLRLDGLCRLLLRDQVDLDQYGPPYRELREALSSKGLVGDGEERAFLDALQADPDDDVTWRVYGDWLLDQGEGPPGIRLLGCALRFLGAEPVQLGDHVVSACLARGGGDHDQWFAFDDAWASANPVLANAMTRFFTRWDVLSTGNERRFE